MRKNRVLALLLALLLVVASVPVFAEGTITVTATDANSTSDTAYILININNTTENDVQLNEINCTTPRALNNDGNLLGNSVVIPKGTAHTLMVYSGIQRGVSGSVTEVLELKFEGMATPVTTSVSLTFEQEQQQGFASATDNRDIIKLSSYDEYGLYVPAPSGNAGEFCQVRLPILCARGSISNVTVTPVLSTSLDEFPFEIQNVDYTLAYPGYIGNGQVLEFQYNNLKLSETVTSGQKVDFKVDYFSSTLGEYTSSTLSVYVNVIKGYSEGTGTNLSSTPKLILDAYSISSDKIYAGETFDVTFTLRNTSSEEAVKNIQLKISDTAEVGKLMPANNSSNTLYIDKIGKGDTHTETISLQSAPDTEAKAYTLNLDLSYEGDTTGGAYTATETIVVPILQKIRIKVDDPVIYDEAWLNESCALYVALYNMGKSSLYNCMIDVEGEGLAMEETYFGGTVNSGSTMRADFSIIPSVAGQIDGFVVITYEDVYGEQMEEKLPLSLFVNEAAVMDPMLEDTMMMDPVIVDEGSGFPWLWVLLGIVVLGGGVAAVIVLKHRRKKELEDV